MKPKKPEKKYLGGNIGVTGREERAYNQGLSDMEAYYTQPSDVDGGLNKILNKLVVAQLPFPLSVPKEFALKCAERAKEEVKEARSQIKSLFKLRELGKDEILSILKNLKWLTGGIEEDGSISYAPWISISRLPEIAQAIIDARERK